MLTISSKKPIKCDRHTMEIRYNHKTYYTNLPIVLEQMFIRKTVDCITREVYKCKCKYSSNNKTSINKYIRYDKIQKCWDKNAPYPFYPRVLDVVRYIYSFLEFYNLYQSGYYLTKNLLHNDIFIHMIELYKQNYISNLNIKLII